jgi:hypothetical protein
MEIALRGGNIMFLHQNHKDFLPSVKNISFYLLPAVQGFINRKNDTNSRKSV